MVGPCHSQRITLVVFPRDFSTRHRLAARTMTAVVVVEAIKYHLRVVRRICALNIAQMALEQIAPIFGIVVHHFLRRVEQFYLKSATGRLRTRH
jgi:hypothetical protein